MPLPDNFNDEAFNRTWGNAAEWEGVYEANACAFDAAIRRAFDEYPLNANLRVVATSKAFGLFSTSLNKYMPLVGAKKREQLDACLGRLMDSVTDENLEASLQDAGELAYCYKLLLEKQQEESDNV